MCFKFEIIFISSLAPNSALAQALSMNQLMNNAGDSANQPMKNKSQESKDYKRENQSANQTGEEIQQNTSDFGANISEGAKKNLELISLE